MRILILYLAFLEGSLIMATELVGGAIIVPFYGNGLTVWTFVLGLTMTSLATGYLTGAFAIKKINPEKLLSFVLPLAVLFFFAMPAIAQRSFESATSDTFVQLVLKGVLPVFFLPLFFLGMLSTVLVQMLSEKGNSPGNASGTVYGVSTLAGIFTALSLGLYLLDAFSIQSILFGFSIVGISGLLVYRFAANAFMRKGPGIGALVLICLIFFGQTTEENEIENNAVTLYKSNGILGEVKVTRDLRDNTTMFYVNNALQSTLGSNGYASLPYVKYICYFLSHRNKNDKVLLAGMGGGNIVRDLNSLGFFVDVVELDKRVIKSAIDYFGVNATTSRIIVDDARHYINTCKKKYDIVVLDLSLGETIPSNVYTLESFNKIHGLLSENGMVVLHLFSSENGEGIHSIQSLGKTLQKSGFIVYLLNAEVKPDLPSPYVFIASKKSIDFSSLTYSLYGLKGSRILSSPDGDIRKFDFSAGEILTDDKPLLEIYQRDVVSFFRKGYMRDRFKK